MKKFFVLAVVFCAVLCAGLACADEGEKMTIDDVTFGKAYKIKGYAVVTFEEFSFIDVVVQNNAPGIRSGNEADFAYLTFDMRNLAKKEAKFLGNISVKVIYDDEYEYYGFVKQFDYNRSISEPIRGEIPLDPMYTGHYVSCCALPNFVIQDQSAPLRMIITINGHEFTYHIRK
ncbi:MAG: hypothetical protein IJU07_03305 [Synergistaceae bacterium]|nr:hypothetical protein [Synergistaceae bacterium]